MSKTKTALMTSKIIGIIQLIIGCFIAALFGLTAIFSMFDNEKDGVGTIIILWILTFIGVGFIFCGERRMSIQKFRRYVLFLSSDSTGSIYNLASTTGDSPEKVRKNLEFMINRGYFTSAYIDYVKNCIIVVSDKLTMNYNEISKNDMEYMFVTCKCCGRVSRVSRVQKGKSGKCDYCGSTLK